MPIITLLADIGESWRQSDGSVYVNSNLGYAIENQLLNVCKGAKVGKSSRKLSYDFVGNDTFDLKRHMMRPYNFQNLLRLHL